jgi:hypothetical protein
MQRSPDRNVNEERKHKSDTELPAREPSASEAAESNVH